MSSPTTPIALDRELLEEFVSEANERLGNIESDLLAIEQEPGTSSDAVNAVFRAVHSIKGAAGFLELKTIEVLSHSIEQVLNAFRNGEILPDTARMSVIFQGIDRLKRLIANIEQSNGEDVTAEQTALRAIVDHPAATSASAPQPDARTENAIPADALREFLQECQENLDQIDTDLLALESSPADGEPVKRLFRSLHTIKGSSGFLGLNQLQSVTHAGENLLSRIRQGEVRQSSEVATTLLSLVDAVRQMMTSLETCGTEGNHSWDDLCNRLERFAEPRARTGVASHLIPQSPSPASISGPAAAVSAGSVPSEVPLPATAKTGATSEAGDSTKSAAITETSIRVDVALLDRLMTRVGELVLSRNQIVQHVTRYADNSLATAAQRLSLITAELQEDIMKTRMQPIGNVWAKFPRVVRDLALQLGKQVRIEMDGKETELDKTIIEAIKDPLTHIVRNSIDHGIETPAVRRQAGKPEEGCLALRAYHEGGQVNIEISDDGAGLNLDRVRAKAVERGLISAEQASRIGEKELTNLIFLPGFSTAEKLTNVSGRGVGMDVVRTNIEKIGGTIELTSRSGHGTTIRVRIPLTLAILPTLLVTCKGDRFAIPQVSLLELVRIDADEVATKIERFENSYVYRLRGNLLPLISLRTALGMEDNARDGSGSSGEIASNGENVNIVVLRADEREFGLIVDRIHDTEEIVVKPLARQLSGIPAYAGATILGDGCVALILDVAGLEKHAGLNRKSPSAEKSEKRNSDTDSRSRQDDSVSLLVLEVGEQPLALPMSTVTRLEKIAPARLEHSDGQTVVQYRDHILPLITLANVLGLPSSPATGGPLDVVVFGEGTTAVGMVVDRVVDIVTTPIRPARRPANPGLAGTAVVKGRVTDLVDPAVVCREVRPGYGSIQ